MEWTGNPEWWQAIGQGVSALAVVAILYQIWRAGKVDENQTRWQIQATGFNIYRTLVDRPDLRPYFYDNVEVPMPTDSESTLLRARVQAASEMLLDYFETLIISFPLVDDRTEKAWQTYMCGLYNTSPALRDFMRQRPGQFDPELHDMLTSPR